jgi:hypothetical protein
MTDERSADRPPRQVTIRNAVMHMAGDQPLVADLFAPPDPGDSGLLCTNLRTLDGKRPIFADDSRSTFFFPYTQIRFLEILPARDAPPLLDAPGANAGASATPEPEADLEIDEDFLRRVRDA